MLCGILLGFISVIFLLLIHEIDFNKNAECLRELDILLEEKNLAADYTFNEETLHEADFGDELKDWKVVKELWAEFL